MHKSKLLLTKPINAGTSILDLSKHLMHDFYYNKLKCQYWENCDLLYTDTDCLLLEVKTWDFYKDMEQTITEYDTSDYPNFPIYIRWEIQKVICKMSDECAGRPMWEYVGYILKCILY